MRPSTYQVFSLIASASLASTYVIPGQSFNPHSVLKRASLAGQATFYGGNVQGGACSFSTYTLPSNILGTALSSSNWANSAECGACVEVTGPSGNSVLAMIVDECPGCGDNHLDLFPDAFDSLASASTGVIDVTWTYTSCPITSPLILVNKSGVSAYWFSMQVVNANQAITSLEVSTDGGSTWQETTRQTYNFFENESGFGTTEVDVRVTGSNGNTVIVQNVEVTSGGSQTAASNFAGASSAAAVVASSSAISAVVASSSSASAEATTLESTTPATAVAEVAVPSISSSTSVVPVVAVASASSEAATAAAAITTPTTAAIIAPSAAPTSGSSVVTSVIMVTVTAGRPIASAAPSADYCLA